MSNNSIYSVFDIVVIDEYYNIGKHDSSLYKALRAIAARAIVVSLSRTLIDVGVKGMTLGAGHWLRPVLPLAPFRSMR